MTWKSFFDHFPPRDRVAPGGATPGGKQGFRAEGAFRPSATSHHRYRFSRVRGVRHHRGPLSPWMKYVDPTADAQNLTRVAPNHALEPSKVKNRGPQRFLGYPGRFPTWKRKIFRLKSAKSRFCQKRRNLLFSRSVYNSYLFWSILIEYQNKYSLKTILPINLC